MKRKHTQRTGIILKGILWAVAILVMTANVAMATPVGTSQSAVSVIAPMVASWDKKSYVIFKMASGDNYKCGGSWNKYLYVRHDNPNYKMLYALLLMSKAQQKPVYCVYESGTTADPAGCPVNYCEMY